MKFEVGTRVRLNATGRDTSNQMREYYLRMHIDPDRDFLVIDGPAGVKYTTQVYIESLSLGGRMWCDVMYLELVDPASSEAKKKCDCDWTEVLRSGCKKGHV